MPLEPSPVQLKYCKAKFSDRREEILRRFGRNIRQARLAMPGHVTCVDVANAIGLDPRSVQRIEQGTRGLSVTTAWSIAYALGVDMNDLVGMEPVDPPRRRTRKSQSKSESKNKKKF